MPPKEIGSLALERADGNWSFLRLDEGDATAEWASDLLAQLDQGKAKLLVMHGAEMRMAEVEEAVL